VYEVYVRSFADSNGDGVGDVNGITSHLDYLGDLGVDGIWLTPIFTSPQFDFGYDVSDYCSIHHEYGTLQDVERLIEEAHRRNIAVILDVILGHTSIEHPWFRAHPGRYLWADNVPNNWLSVFGGSAWEHDSETGRYYYHRYYREQPSLNWNNPDVRAAMHEVFAFWVARGADGFRLDSLDGLAVDPELRDEPLMSNVDLEGRENDSWAEFWTLDHIYTSNQPKVVEELREVTRAFPDTAFVIEADLPGEQLKPYMAVADSAFAFDFMRAPMNGKALARIIEGAGEDGNRAWALSNHDQPRLVSRWGRAKAKVAAMLLLTLPGWSFIYQGDEIGMVDGPGGPVVYDRSGRDKVRHPMQWTREGGFSRGVPWLPMNDPDVCNVADQGGRPDSMLELYRGLIRIRRTLKGEISIVKAETDHLIFRRGSHLIALNLSEEPQILGNLGRVVFATTQLSSVNALPPNTGIILELPEHGLR
jgi:alpha-glucosidase